MKLDLEQGQFNWLEDLKAAFENALGTAELLGHDHAQEAHSGHARDTGIHATPEGKESWDGAAENALDALQRTDELRALLDSMAGEINNLRLRLSMMDGIDAGGSAILDRIETANDVILIHGRMGAGKVFI